MAVFWIFTPDRIEVELLLHDKTLFMYQLKKGFPFKESIPIIFHKAFRINVF